MAIVIKHGGNVAPAAVAAFGGGQGKRQAEDGRQALQIAASDRQQRRSLAAQESSAWRNREWQRRDQNKAREMQLEDRATARDQFLEDTESADQRQRDMFDYRIDSQQRAEFEQINAQIDMVRRDKTMAPDEQEEAIAYLTRELYGLAQPKPHLRDDKLTPQERFEQSTIRDPESGTLYGIKPDGSFHKLSDAGQASTGPTYQDTAKMMKEAATLFTDEKGVTDWDKVDEYMERARGFHDRVAEQARSRTSGDVVIEELWEGASLPDDLTDEDVAAGDLVPPAVDMPDSGRRPIRSSTDDDGRLTLTNRREAPQVPAPASPAAPAEAPPRHGPRVDAPSAARNRGLREQSAHTKAMAHDDSSDMDAYALAEHVGAETETDFQTRRRAEARVRRERLDGSVTTADLSASELAVIRSMPESALQGVAQEIAEEQGRPVEAVLAVLKRIRRNH